MPVSSADQEPLSLTLSAPSASGCPKAAGQTYDFTIAIAGGVAPYSYQWRAGDGYQNLTGTDSLFSITSDGLCHDWNVSITVADANGCSVQQSCTLNVGDNQPPQASTSPQPLDDAGFGCRYLVPDLTGRATDNCGLQSVVQVPPAGDTATGQFTAELHITDKCGNSTVVPIVLTVPDPITFTISSSPVTCYGDNDGTLTVSNVAGGDAPYIYSFYGQENTTGVFTDMPVTGLTTLIVTDANGCTGEEPNAEVDGPDRIVAHEAIGTHTNVDCNGNANGSVQIEVVSGGYLQ